MLSEFGSPNLRMGNPFVRTSVECPLELCSKTRSLDPSGVNAIMLGVFSNAVDSWTVPEGSNTDCTVFLSESMT